MGFLSREALFIFELFFSLKKSLWVMAAWPMVRSERLLDHSLNLGWSQRKSGNVLTLDVLSSLDSLKWTP